MIILCGLLAGGCMFVTESYSPVESGGYAFEGSCVGFTWDECRARAEALCADMGQQVGSLEQAGGPANKPGIAVVPKKVRVSCREKQDVLF